MALPRLFAALPVLTCALALCLPETSEAAGLASKEKKPAAAKPAPKAKKKVSKKRGEKKKNDDEEEYQWAVGLVGGGNFASIGGEPLGGIEGTETNMNVGMNLGVLALYNLASFADVEFGLGYSTKGYSTEITNDLPDETTGAKIGTKTTTVNDTFSYVELPIGIRLNYPAGSIRPYLSAGIYAGFLVGSERESTDEREFNDTGVCPGDDAMTKSKTCSNTKTAEVPGAASFDFGFRAQLGAEFDVTDAFSVFVGAGYTRSFTDPIDETAKAETATSSSGQTAADDMGGAAAAGDMTGNTDTTPAKAAEFKNASQAHSVIQGVAGLLYQF